MTDNKIVNKEDRKVLFTFNHDSLTDLVSETKKTLKRRSSNWKNQPFVNDLDFIERLQRNENILIAYVESFKIDKDVTFKAVYNGRNLGLGEYSFVIDISGLEHRRCSRFAYAANESLKTNWKSYRGFFESKGIVELPRNDFENFLNSKLSRYLNQ